MSQPTDKSGKVSKDKKPKLDKEAQAEAQIRSYYALGLKVIAHVTEGRLDADTLQKLTGETGHGADNLRKARVFDARYTAKQLDELCGIRTPEGMPLPWRHVRQLLMLPPGEDRGKLQRKAAEKGLSLEELVAAIPKKVRRRQTRRKAAGRSGGRGPSPTRCVRSRGTATNGCAANATRNGGISTGSRASRGRSEPVASARGRRKRGPRYGR